MKCLPNLCFLSKVLVEISKAPNFRPVQCVFLWLMHLSIVRRTLQPRERCVNVHYVRQTFMYMMHPLRHESDAPFNAFDALILRFLSDHFQTLTDLITHPRSWIYHVFYKVLIFSQNDKQCIPFILYPTCVINNNKNPQSLCAATQKQYDSSASYHAVPMHDMTSSSTKYNDVTE